MAKKICIGKRRKREERKKERKEKKRKGRKKEKRRIRERKRNKGIKGGGCNKSKRKKKRKEKKRREKKKEKKRKEKTTGEYLFILYTLSLLTSPGTCPSSWSSGGGACCSDFQVLALEGAALPSAWCRAQLGLFNP